MAVLNAHRLPGLRRPLEVRLRFEPSKLVWASKPTCATLKAMELLARDGDAGGRLDRFMSAALEGTSRSEVLRWIRAGRVRVDGVVERKPARKLRGGERVVARPLERPQLRGEPEAIEISILHEDHDIAVVDKAAGMTVHAGAGVASGTLVNALLHHVGSLSNSSDKVRPGIVHRLDRFTSGVLVVAKNDAAQASLQAQFQRREVAKLYWAAVEGVLPPDPHDSQRLLRHGRPVMLGGAWWLRIEMPLRRDKRNRVKMAASPLGREAISDVRLLRAGKAHSLAEVRIHTGRTHQIRVHLASAGHPVVGDALYGARRQGTEGPAARRFLLHSRVLEFAHPATGRKVRYEAPLPADFSARLADLGL